MSLRNVAPGDQVGLWVVLSFNGSTRYGHRKALCRCACGTERSVRVDVLKSGQSGGCGCISPTLRHGRSYTREHETWCRMKQRCNNPKNPRYSSYGGRGIRVCDRWNRAFEAFLEDMGERPPGDYSIERIDNDGNYEPSNCRWATMREQSKNTRRTRLLTFDGKTRPARDWARLVGLEKATLLHRVRSGWEIERALFAPVRSAAGRSKQNAALELYRLERARQSHAA